jgi:multimeric flavodoxin WrbA
MKVALIFYSYSGNTKKAVVYLKDKLIYNNIEVEMIEIKLVNEERNFFKQCLAAFRKKTPCICESLKYDLGAFDLAIFSTAVWAFKIRLKA